MGFCRRQLRPHDACLPGLGSGFGGLWTPTASRGVLDASRSSTDCLALHISLNQRVQPWLKCPLVCSHPTSVQLVQCANTHTTVLDGGTGFLKAGYAGQVRQLPYTSA